MEFELREWQMENINEVTFHANNSNIADNLRNAFKYPYYQEDAAQYITSCMDADKKKQLCRAIVVENEVIGSIGIFSNEDVYSKTAEIGYWLSEDYWGKGIMTSAVIQLCKEAFELFDICRIYAEPFAHNMQSRRVLEKAGFELEGIKRCSVFKNGVIYDSCMYALLQ